ncbi:uncharacterized protein PV06_11288 [Exophiala oligosperma]|uniref:Major facilitator superfamily (MFS) profile domain-containing protein n=1 Tax=Exophiala oligosperma TaxID=215243 RepID=A0A0D2CZP3_9EURO|nr:uncharacterized protein PV06_11288 [Exophiala oligosperma]KIW36473.1 hypothetical protein PV06_11288 [Exophiala oligosperma]
MQDNTFTTASGYELHGTVKIYTDRDSDTRKHGEVVPIPQPTADPNDPLNWPHVKKFYNMALIGAFTFCSAAIITGPLLGWADTAKDLDISYDELNNGYAISIMFLGFGNFPVAIASRNRCCLFRRDADFLQIARNYGRRPVYVLCSLGACLTSLWTALYQTKGSYYARSVFIGIFCCPYEGMVTTMVNDVTFVHQRGTFMALMFWMALLGTDLGTICGGFIASSPIPYINWRWIGYVMCIFFGVLFLLFLFTFEETRYTRPSSHVISAATAPALRSTDQSLGQNNNSEKDLAEPLPSQPLDLSETFAVPPKKTYLQKLALWQLESPEYRRSTLTEMKEILTLFTFPVVIWAGLIYGINLGWYVVILSMLPQVLGVAPYDFSAVAQGYTRFGTIIGAALAFLISGPTSDYVMLWLARRNGGVREAEHRLPLFLTGVIIMPAALLIFGLSAADHRPWFPVVFGEAMTSFAYTAQSEIAMAYVVDCYRPIAVESFVGVIVIRNLLGFAWTYAVTPWLAASGVKIISITTAAITIAVYLTVIPMMVWGKRMRMWTSSRYPLSGRKDY